ncbi:hypothetical protein JCM10207_006897 [Rhodosporidiobolus poonsookiae]
MTDTITFLTSDTPPAELTLPLAALLQSKVLSDLGALPRPTKPNKDDKPQVTETEEELKPFFKLLKGKKVLEEEMDDKKWIALAKMSDKYNCETVRTTVERKVWQLLADDRSPLLAFTLASHVHNRDLIKRVGPVALSELEGSSGSLDLPSGMLDRMTAWKELLAIHAMRTFMSCTIVPAGCNNRSCYGYSRTEAWMEMARRAVAMSSAASPFSSSTSKDISCSQCMRWCIMHATALDAEFLETLPDIPT